MKMSQPLNTVTIKSSMLVAVRAAFLSISVAIVLSYVRVGVEFMFVI